MNWFERYSVVGIYFLVISLIWFLCLTAYTAADIETQVIGLLAFIFLPVGYILTIFSQYCYYSGLLGEGIHKRIVTDILDESLRKKLGLNNNSPESLCDLKLTSFLRLEHKDKEAVQLIIPFCTRRLDIITISNSMILYTILSPIAMILLTLVFRPSFFSIDWLHCFIAAILSAVLIYILIKSKAIFENQILEVNREIWKKAGIA